MAVNFEAVIVGQVSDILWPNFMASVASFS